MIENFDLRLAVTDVHGSHRLEISRYYGGVQLRLLSLGVSVRDQPQPVFRLEDAQAFFDIVERHQARVAQAVVRAHSPIENLLIVDSDIRQRTVPYRS